MDIHIYSYCRKAEVSSPPNCQIYCTQSLYYPISLLKLPLELSFWELLSLTRPATPSTTGAVEISMATSEGHWLREVDSSWITTIYSHKADFSRIFISDPPYHSKHCMGLLGSGKSFFFRCDSQRELDTWMGTLQQAIWMYMYTCICIYVYVYIYISTYIFIYQYT